MRNRVYDHVVISLLAQILGDMMLLLASLALAYRDATVILVDTERASRTLHLPLACAK